MPVKDEREGAAEKVTDAQIKKYWKAEEDSRLAPRGNYPYPLKPFTPKLHFSPGKHLIDQNIQSTNPHFPCTKRSSVISTSPPNTALVSVFHDWHGGNGPTCSVSSHRPRSLPCFCEKKTTRQVRDAASSPTSMNWVAERLFWLNDDQIY